MKTWSIWIFVQDKTQQFQAFAIAKDDNITKHVQKLKLLLSVASTINFIMKPWKILSS